MAAASKYYGARSSTSKCFKMHKHTQLTPADVLGFRDTLAADVRD